MPYVGHRSEVVHVNIVARHLSRDHPTAGAGRLEIFSNDITSDLPTIRSHVVPQSDSIQSTPLPCTRRSSVVAGIIPDVLKG